MSNTLSGGRPIAALSPFTTIGRSMSFGFSVIALINADSSFCALRLSALYISLLWYALIGEQNQNPTF